MYDTLKDFTPAQSQALLAKVGYTGNMDADDVQKFLAASPAASAKLGRWTNAARQMVMGRPVRGFAAGGKVEDPWSTSSEPTPERVMSVPSQAAPTTNTKAAKDQINQAQGWIDEYNKTGVVPSAALEAYPQDQTTGTLAPTPDRSNPPSEIMGEPISTTIYDPPPPAPPPAPTASPQTGFVTPEGYQGVQQQINTQGVQSVTPTLDPTTGASTQVPDAAQIDPTTGQVVGPTPQMSQATPITAAQMATPEAGVAGQMATPAPMEVGQVGTPEEGVAQEMVDPQMGQAAQVGTPQAIEAATVSTPERVRAAQMEASLVGGRAESVLSGAQAAQGMPSADATVYGQMTRIAQEFDEGTPPWAAPQMRQAMQTMAARGLGSSSMAGAAITQAAIESAMPMAIQDAKTVAAFEMKNLDNRQQMTIFRTQQRMASLFSDQAAQNAASQFNAQSQNQVSMFNSQLMANAQQFNASQVNAIRQFNASRQDRADEVNVAARNAMQQFNLSRLDTAGQFNAAQRQAMQQFNLGRQDTASQFNVAQANVMAQTEAQRQDVASQFNVGQANQMAQFNLGRTDAAAQFNAAQLNALAQFNASRGDAIEQFNAEITEQRNQFNAKNDVLIQQANVQARNRMFELQVQTASQEEQQEIAINAENKQLDARMLHETTQAQLAREFQAEQDAIAHAITEQESAKDRGLSLLTTTMSIETQKELQEMMINENNKDGLGELFGWIFGG